jgi:hypothetical protein
MLVQALIQSREALKQEVWQGFCSLPAEAELAWMAGGRGAECYSWRMHG